MVGGWVGAWQCGGVACGVEGAATTHIHPHMICRLPVDVALGQWHPAETRAKRGWRPMEATNVVKRQPT